MIMLISLFLLLSGILFFQPVAQAAHAIVALTCRTDHGHFGKRSVPCYCRCHVMPRPFDHTVASPPGTDSLV